MPLSAKALADALEFNYEEFWEYIRRYETERLEAPELKKDALARHLKRMDELSVEGDEDEWPALSPKEFCDSIGPTPPMIAAGLLAPNTVLLVSARPKLGKTFLMLQIADDVASGNKLFGRFEIERPGPVFYLMMEGSRSQFKDRVTQRGMYDRDPEVRILHKRIDLSKRENVMRLVEMITPYNPALVIVDTARQAFNMEDWNNASMVQTRMQPLIEAVQRNGPIKFPEGCACVIVHHNNKNTLAEGGDKISGTNAFQGIVDGYIILDKKKRVDGGDLQFEGECEGRIDMPEKLSFLMNTETLDIKALADEEADSFRAQNATASMRKHFPAILTLAEQGEISAATVQRKMGLALSYVSRILKLMAEEGELIVCGKKREGSRGSASTLYAAPSSDVGNNTSSIYKEKNNSDPEEDAPPSPAADPLNGFFPDKSATLDEDEDDPVITR